MKMNRLRKHVLACIVGCVVIGLAVGCRSKETTGETTGLPALLTDDRPADLRAYFDSLMQSGTAAVFVHNAYDDAEERTLNDIYALADYAAGHREYYPAEEVKRALGNMAFEQGYLFGHNGEESNPGEVFLFRFLQQAALRCPDLSLIADATSPDGNAGFLYYPEWSANNPLYSLLLYRNGEGGFSVEMIGEKGNDKINKLFQLTDGQGATYYLCSCDVSAFEFRQFLYRITDGHAELLVSTSRQSSGAMAWPAPDTDDYTIIFNPQKLCWNYCYQKGDYYHQIAGTRTLFLVLEGENSYFYVE